VVGYESAYGKTPPIRDILAKYESGDMASKELFKRIYVVGDEDAGTFEKFQAKYDVLIHGSRYAEFVKHEERLPAYLEELCYFCNRIIANQRRNGVGYAEQRIMISSKVEQKHARQIADAILNTYAKYENSDFKPRLALSLPRENPWYHWEMVKDIALGPLGHLLTGVDFCNFEEGYPPKNQASFFGEVKAFNQKHPERALAILYHVGESFKDKSLQSAVRWVHEAAQLGANRLGHAISLGIDPEVFENAQRTETVEEHMDQLQYDLQHAEGLRKFGVSIEKRKIEEKLIYCRSLSPSSRIEIRCDNQTVMEIKSRQRYAMGQIKSLGAIIEVCPTSNRRIGNIRSEKHHPVHAFLETGLPFVIASDDPGVFDTNTVDEINWLLRATNRGPDYFDEVVEASWRYRSEILSGREPYLP